MLSSCPDAAAPERGRLLLREPNAALLLGPRIGQRLGEAGDRGICRRGPGAAGSAEPLRRFERIGEVRCYSRLNVGRHQVERIERKPARPRSGWSGVHEIVPPMVAEQCVSKSDLLYPDCCCCRL